MDKGDPLWVALLIAGVFIDNPFRVAGYTEPVKTEHTAPGGHGAGTRH